MINHTIVYVTDGYSIDGSGKQLIQIDASCNYDHKTRKGLMRFADNAAFWDANSRNLHYCGLYTVDGNAA